MNIYVDFDDCLCETARYFSILAAQMFGLDIPYEKIKYFNLQQSFSLTDEQYDDMMIQGHKPEVLLSYDVHLVLLRLLVNGLMNMGLSGFRCTASINTVVIIS